MSQEISKAADSVTENPSPFTVLGNASISSWKMTALRVAAQLILGAQKGAEYYGEVRERLDTIEGRSTVSKALATAAAQQAVLDPQLMERAKARFLSSAMQKQENIEAVVLGAGSHLIEHAESLPRDATGGNMYHVGNEADSPAPDEEPHRPINPDWAASFADIAENATSDELRDRLARVLAGEISSPGSYSRATVRLIAELEKSQLDAMQAVLPYLLNDDIIRIKQEPSVPNYEMLSPLLEAGLITDAGSLLSRTWSLSGGGAGELPIKGKNHLLLVDLNPGMTIDLPVTILTKTGNAVVELLGRPDEREILKRIAADIPSRAYTRIRMGTFSEPDRATNLQQLYPVATPSHITPSTNASPFTAPLFK